MNVQLPLGLTLKDGATFATFHPGMNSQLVSSLQGCAAGEGEPYIYLWGGPDGGKTHLLQAACQQASSRGATAAYIPLADVLQFPEATLDGLEHLTLVCLDDAQAVAGRDPWELAVFALFNRIRDGGGRLVVAGRSPPAELGLRLPDLVSRLGSGPVYALRALDDDAKLAALRLRATGRGFELPEEVGRYLLRRCPREMGALFGLLDRLDRASLAAQRRLTIPFIKTVLDGAPPATRGPE